MMDDYKSRKDAELEATETARLDGLREKVRKDRAALEQVPFTGNTAGQPIAEAEVPFNVGAGTSVLDGDKAALEAKEARDVAARTSTGTQAQGTAPRTTGITPTAKSRGR